MNGQQNITRIKVVYKALGELIPDVVFVGGATVQLYADRPTSEVRPTDYVDILIELAYYGNYAAFEEKLRAKGFTNDIESGVICRYTIKGITVDVMPTSENILGFANKWYKEAFANAQFTELDDELTISIFTAPYFIATKLEAFKDRGGNDGRTSTDFEDIIFLLNNRTTIWEEMNNAPASVKRYLVEEFTKLLSSPYIEEWISAHLDYEDQRRLTFIIGGLHTFITP